MANPLLKSLQILSITTSLVASGAIATLSLFDIPELASQPASRSLPLTRWLFSRGSHIFPPAALTSAVGFAVLAYDAAGRSLLPAKLLQSGGAARWYVAAALLSYGIAPFTQFVMLPTNFALIQKNEDLGGARSAKSAAAADKKKGGSGAGSTGRSAEESVDSKGDVSQWTDLSGPMERTARESTKEEDAEVRALLEKFGKLNMGRAALIGAGGVCGLIAALA